AQADTAQTVSDQFYDYTSSQIADDSENYPRLAPLMEKFNDGSQHAHSSFNDSYIAGARAMSIAPDDVAQQTKKNNREDDPLLVHGSSYNYWEKDRNLILDVYSGSMGRTIPLHIMLPQDPDVTSPVLYLLNGAGGGEDSANWSARTDIQQYFQDDNVYVVTPLEGMFSYYTDWQQPVPELHGENKWTTFLTQELPSIMNKAFDTNGKNGIIGMSMSGSSVLSLAEWAHDRGENGSEGTKH